MSSEHMNVFTKENLDTFLKELGKEYRRLNGKSMPDVIGILAEHEQRGDPITMERIDTAVCNLYGGWEEIPANSVSFIRDTMAHGEFEKAYESVRAGERQAKEILLQFQEDYPGVTNTDNVDNILTQLKKRKYQQER